MGLTFRTQAQRLIPVKGFFAWLAAAGELPYDPASSLVLPKTEHRLPEATLSVGGGRGGPRRSRHHHRISGCVTGPSWRSSTPLPSDAWS